MSPQLKAVLKDLLFLYHNHFCICNTSYLAHNIWKTSTYQAMYTWTWTWTGIFGLKSRMLSHTVLVVTKLFSISAQASLSFSELIRFLNRQSSSEGNILSLVSARLKSAKSRCWSTSYASYKAPSCLRRSTSTLYNVHCTRLLCHVLCCCCCWCTGKRLLLLFPCWENFPVAALKGESLIFAATAEAPPLSLSCCYPAANSDGVVERDGGGEEAGQEPVHQAVREAEDPSGREGDVVEQGEHGGQQQGGGGGQRNPHQAPNP